MHDVVERLVLLDQRTFVLHRLAEVLVREKLNRISGLDGFKVANDAVAGDALQPARGDTDVEHDIPASPDVDTLHGAKQKITS